MNVLDGVNFLLTQGLATLPQALEMASLRPARQLDLPQQYGLTIGAPADVLLLQPHADRHLSLQCCVKQGAKVWDDESTDADTLNHFSSLG